MPEVPRCRGVAAKIWPDLASQSSALGEDQEPDATETTKSLAPSHQTTEPRRHRFSCKSEVCEAGSGHTWSGRPPFRPRGRFSALPTTPCATLAYRDPPRAGSLARKQTRGAGVVLGRRGTERPMPRRCWVAQSR